MSMLNILSCEPGMVQAVLCRDPLLRILVEHLRDEILRLIRHTIPVSRVELELLLDDVAEDLFVVVSFEGWVTAQEDEQNDTEGPNVALLVVVAFQHFRSDVVWSTNNSVHTLNLSLLTEPL